MLVTIFLIFSQASKFFVSDNGKKSWNYAYLTRIIFVFQYHISVNEHD